MTGCGVHKSRLHPPTHVHLLSYKHYLFPTCSVYDKELHCSGEVSEMKDMSRREQQRVRASVRDRILLNMGTQQKDIRLFR